jgi:hypothetical protein
MPLKSKWCVRIKLGNLYYLKWKAFFYFYRNEEHIYVLFEFEDIKKLFPLYEGEEEM